MCLGDDLYIFVYTYTYDLLCTDLYWLKNALPRGLLWTPKIKNQYSRPIL